MSSSTMKKAARAVQRASGDNYTTAHRFVQANAAQISDMRREKGIHFHEAALALWEQQALSRTIFRPDEDDE